MCRPKMKVLHVHLWHKGSSTAKLCALSGFDRADKMRQKMKFWKTALFGRFANNHGYTGSILNVLLRVSFIELHFPGGGCARLLLVCGKFLLTSLANYDTCLVIPRACRHSHHQRQWSRVRTCEERSEGELFVRRANR